MSDLRLLLKLLSYFQLLPSHCVLAMSSHVMSDLRLLLKLPSYFQPCRRTASWRCRPTSCPTSVSC